MLLVFLSAALLMLQILYFYALISLPVGLPLLVASADNKLNLCLGLEECTSDVACMTRQFMLHWWCTVYGMWLHHIQYFHESLFIHSRCVCVCVAGHSNVCAFLKTYPLGNISHIVFDKSKSA